METRSEKSAEAVVVASKGRRAERGEVFETMLMLNARRQKSVQAERAGVVHGEAVRDRVSDEAGDPRHDTESIGPVLLQAVLARENLQQAWKRVKANKGVAGVDGLDIEQTRQHLVTAWPKIREHVLQGTCLLGWKAYFELAQTLRIWRSLDEWLRHRLRAIQLRHWRRGSTITGS